MPAKISKSELMEKAKKFQQKHGQITCDDLVFHPALPDTTVLYNYFDSIDELRDELENYKTEEKKKERVIKRNCEKCAWGRKTGEKQIFCMIPGCMRG